MDPRINIAALGLIAALAGCTTIKVTESSSVTEQIGRAPDLSQDAETPVGGTIYSQYRYWSKTGYRLLDPVATKIMLATVNVSAGDFVLPAEADGGVAFCTEKNALIDPLVGPIKPVCFVDTKNNGNFDVVKAAPGAVWFKSEISPTKYAKGELIIPRPDAKKAELLYQGYSSKILKLSYREYMNDFARPAYFQDVTYDITEFPTTVTFRTVRIKVLKADNNGLRYQILSGF